MPLCAWSAAAASLGMNSVCRISMSVAAAGSWAVEAASLPRIWPDCSRARCPGLVADANCSRARINRNCGLALPVHARGFAASVVVIDSYRVAVCRIHRDCFADAETCLPAGVRRSLVRPLPCRVTMRRNRAGSQFNSSEPNPRVHRDKAANLPGDRSRPAGRAPVSCQNPAPVKAG